MKYLEIVNLRNCFNASRVVLEIVNWGGGVTGEERAWPLWVACVGQKQAVCQKPSGPWHFLWPGRYGTVHWASSGLRRAGLQCWLHRLLDCLILAYLSEPWFSHL